MKKIITAIFIAMSFTSFSQSNSYENAWKALNENKRTEAAGLIQEALKDPLTYEDAYITGLYLDTYNGREKKVTDFESSFYSKSTNPYPYIYSLWFNEGVLGAYGKKTRPNQLKLVDRIIADPNAPGSLIAGANYQKEMHFLLSADFGKTKLYSDAIGNIRNWQFAGPFENLSESGFYKDYGPLEHPEPEAVFKSLSNADVKWFKPAAEITDGWTPVIYQFNKITGVVYAQNFVSSPEKQTVYCNVGVAGAIKVWINDELVISESKERTTEFDSYTVKYDLEKGVNRILVQLSYTNSTYPNFSVRLTDENYKPLSNIVSSPKYAQYPKVAQGSASKVIALPHFAESYFLAKIKNQPDNPVNYLLLADVYMRSKKLLEARKLMSGLLEKFPDNSLLRVKLVEILVAENNRTLLLEEMAKLKQHDPESLFVSELNLKELYNNEKYEDCEAELEKRIKLHGEDESTWGYKLLLLVKDKKYDEMVKVAEKMYEIYPDRSELIAMMYSIKKEVYKDNKGAMEVYEKYIKNNFNYQVYADYADKLKELGKDAKALEMEQNFIKIFPYDGNGFYKLANYYFSSKQNDKAEDYIGKALAISPYNENYWEKLGDIRSEKKQVAAALDAYNQSLQYDPNQYGIISKVRKLNGKSEYAKLFPEIDIPQLIKNDNPDEAKNTDYGYYFILDQKDVVIYPGGATEEYYTSILKMTNDKGIERYKESSIGYDNTQSLLIEKTEVIKKSGAKIEGERNDNEIVFANLEVGDVVVFKYRLQSYVYGRFAKEYSDKFYFGGQIYSAITRYNLLIPAEQKIDYVFNNSEVKPEIKNVENFRRYSWVITKPEPLKYEPLMPGIGEVGAVLHLSTIASWKEIADWYSDIVNNRTEEDYEITSLYKKLFPDENKKMTQFQKAKIIYEYIESNIKYSSVSFRQSAYVPQKASSTLTTRLGDCKDLSNLFVTLANKAGIISQMVLVDTRDNGVKDMLLPSIGFNHCIAKAQLDGKSYYIELTDNYLPFASLPNTLNGALALEIPTKSMKEKSELIRLKGANKTKDFMRRIMDIKPVGDDLEISVKAIKYGALSSDVREVYLNLDQEKQMKTIEESVAGGYKNNISMTAVDFKDLDKLNDSVAFTYAYKVKNEVAEIGSLSTFRIFYPDVIASMNNFSSEKRDYPVEYWSYEDADQYETIVNITLPAGKKFVELPADEKLTFKGLSFSIKYLQKIPGQLQVFRTFANDRPQQISPADYPAFKSFFEKIIKAEQKFIAYK